MNVSAAGSSAAFADQYSVSVAAKALDNQKQNGEKALALIQSAAAPPVKPGHRVSVMA